LAKLTAHSRSKLSRNVILFSLASLLLFVWVFPLIWAVIVSLKSEVEVLAYPPSVIFEPTMQNYKDALFGGISIVPSLVTSVIVSTITTVLTIVMAVSFEQFLGLPPYQPDQSALAGEVNPTTREKYRLSPSLQSAFLDGYASDMEQLPELVPGIDLTLWPSAREVGLA